MLLLAKKLQAVTRLGFVRSCICFLPGEIQAMYDGGKVDIVSQQVVAPFLFPAAYHSPSFVFVYRH